MLPLYCVEDVDKLSWIKDLKHEEYDMISIQWSSGRKKYYKSKLKSDMVIKLDLTDKDVKKVFDDKFRIGTIAAREMEEIEGIKDRKVGEGDPLFDGNLGYEIRNFVVTYNDEVIMDAIIHHSFYVITSKEIVEEVDKECKK